VRLAIDDCWSRLRSAEHGVLCTAGARRAIDAVPVCFAVVSSSVVTPVDTIKPKETTALGRLRNLERQGGATLLVEHWDPHDWSQLWWVRARLERRSDDDVSLALGQEGERALREKYGQYRNADFARLVYLHVTSLVGWSAAAGRTGGPGDAPLF